MPQILTTRATITCPHGALGQSTPATPIWNIEGGYALAEGDVGVLPACVATPPCVGYTLKSMGLNATQLMQRKIILTTDFQQSLTGLPLTIAELHHVWDDSTPAPLPMTDDAPAIALALRDTVRPAVAVAPPDLAVSLTTMSPAPVSVVFSSFAAFPMQWILTLLNGTAGLSQDVTNGLPTGLDVMPPGGRWTSPALAVTVTMTAAFFTSLGAGRHHLFCTAVSQRGQSGYVDLPITVSP